jgi:hypothetical protein
VTASGDDAFDAVVGLFGMLEVVAGHQLRGEPSHHIRRNLEGWILPAYGVKVWLAPHTVALRFRRRLGLLLRFLLPTGHQSEYYFSRTRLQVFSCFLGGVSAHFSLFL